MNSVLIFVAFLAAMVLVGLTVSRITGSHAWYLDDWQFEAGESVIWRDDAADVEMVPLAASSSLAFRVIRLHRWRVLVTDRRIIIGQKSFGGRPVVSYVLYPGVAPDAESRQIDGGTITRGYSSLAFEPGFVQAHGRGRFHPAYVALKPTPTAALMLREIRIFTDRGDSFRLPAQRGGG